MQLMMANHYLPPCRLLFLMNHVLDQSLFNVCLFTGVSPIEPYSLFQQYNKQFYPQSIQPQQSSSHLSPFLQPIPSFHSSYDSLNQPQQSSNLTPSNPFILPSTYPFPPPSPFPFPFTPTQEFLGMIGNGDILVSPLPPASSQVGQILTRLL